MRGCRRSAGRAIENGRDTRPGPSPSRHHFDGVESAERWTQSGLGWLPESISGGQTTYPWRRSRSKTPNRRPRPLRKVEGPRQSVSSDSNVRPDLDAHARPAGTLRDGVLLVHVAGSGKHCREGAAGVGLSRDVMDAYTWLAIRSRDGGTGSRSSVSAAVRPSPGALLDGRPPRTGIKSAFAALRHTDSFFRIDLSLADAALAASAAAPHGPVDRLVFAAALP
jgi:hypothetical protein